MSRPRPIYPHTEIRNFGEGASEEIYTYPLAIIRLKNGNNPVYGGDVAYLHSDAQNSVVAMSDAAGNWTERRAYWRLRSAHSNLMKIVPSTVPPVRMSVASRIGDILAIRFFSMFASIGRDLLSLKIA